jgi:hypothetical protein
MDPSALPMNVPGNHVNFLLVAISAGGGLAYQQKTKHARDMIRIEVRR